MCSHTRKSVERIILIITTVSSLLLFPIRVECFSSLKESHCNFPPKLCINSSTRARPYQRRTAHCLSLSPSSRHLYLDNDHIPENPTSASRSTVTSSSSSSSSSVSPLPNGSAMGKNGTEIILKENGKLVVGGSGDEPKNGKAGSSNSSNSDMNNQVPSSAVDHRSEEKNIAGKKSEKEIADNLVVESSSSSSSSTLHARNVIGVNSTNEKSQVRSSRETTANIIGRMLWHGTSSVVGTLTVLFLCVKIVYHTIDRPLETHNVPKEDKGSLSTTINNHNTTRSTNTTSPIQNLSNTIQTSTLTIIHSLKSFLQNTYHTLKSISLHVLNLPETQKLAQSSITTLRSTTICLFLLLVLTKRFLTFTFAFLTWVYRAFFRGVVLSFLLQLREDRKHKMSLRTSTRSYGRSAGVPLTKGRLFRMEKLDVEGKTTISRSGDKKAGEEEEEEKDVASLLRLREQEQKKELLHRQIQSKHNDIPSKLTLSKNDDQEEEQEQEQEDNDVTSLLQLLNQQEQQHQELLHHQLLQHQTQLQQEKSLLQKKHECDIRKLRQSIELERCRLNMEYVGMVSMKMECMKASLRGALVGDSTHDKRNNAKFWKKIVSEFEQKEV